jgi:hypothetical protein
MWRQASCSRLRQRLPADALSLPRRARWRRASGCVSTGTTRAAGGWWSRCRGSEGLAASGLCWSGAAGGRGMRQLPLLARVTRLQLGGLNKLSAALEAAVACVPPAVYVVAPGAAGVRVRCGGVGASPQQGAKLATDQRGPPSELRCSHSCPSSLLLHAHSAAQLTRPPLAAAAPCPPARPLLTPPCCLPAP